MPIIGTKLTWILFGIVGVAAGLGLVAGSSAKSSDGGPLGSNNEGTAAAAPQAPVADLLIASGDAPSGWEMRSVPLKLGQFCPTEPTAAVPALERAAVSFEAPDGSGLIGEAVARFDSPTAPLVTSIYDGALACTTWVDDAGVSYQLTQLTQPTIGDGSVAFQVLIQDPATGPVVANLVFVAHDDLLVTVAHLGAGSVDTPLTESVLVAALARAGVDHTAGD